MISSRRFGALAAILAILAASAHAASWSVKSQPARLVNGSPVLIEVKPPVPLASMNGSLLGHTFSFAFDPKTRCWFALAGISLETAPGKGPLEVTGETASSKTSHAAAKLSFSRSLTVVRAKYPKIELFQTALFTTLRARLGVFILWGGEKSFLCSTDS